MKTEQKCLLYKKIESGKNWFKLILYNTIKATSCFYSRFYSFDSRLDREKNFFNESY